MTQELLDLAKKLLEFPSVTPNSYGVVEFVANYLQSLGFDVVLKKFPDEHGIENLYAYKGRNKRGLCFAGHLDVVPAGAEALWSHPPFDPTLVDGNLYGRGVVDMKGAVAAFLWAIKCIVDEGLELKHNLAVLLTMDEEGDARFGTKPMLEWLWQEQDIPKFSHCIVGEPTSDRVIGDTIKNGRRGSISFDLIVHGIQGHVAYPEKAVNPCRNLVNIIKDLQDMEWDLGSKFFGPSNLEVTSIDVGNQVGNVIPAKAVAKFNIRTSDVHASEYFIKAVENVCEKYSDTFELKSHISAEAFLSDNQEFISFASAQVEDVLGAKPVVSTSGGTSDARFIKDYALVMELGLLNKTAHKIDEHCDFTDIAKLSKVYYKLIKDFDLA